MRSWLFSDFELSLRERSAGGVTTSNQNCLSSSEAKVNAGIRIWINNTFLSQLTVRNLMLVFNYKNIWMAAILRWVRIWQYQTQAWRQNFHMHFQAEGFILQGGTIRKIRRTHLLEPRWNNLVYQHIYSQWEYLFKLELFKHEQLDDNTRLWLKHCVFELIFIFFSPACIPVVGRLSIVINEFNFLAWLDEYLIINEM